MYTSKSTKAKEKTYLADYMVKVIVQLEKEKKYVAKLEEYRDKSDTPSYLFPVLNGTLTDEAEVYAGYLNEFHRFNYSDLEKLAKLLFTGTVKISSYYGGALFN